MLVLAVGFVGRYGSNVPSWDDWDMVPTLTGHQPVTLDWLWSQHNEHRIPVPRLLLLGLHWITGIDFRTPMFFNVLAVGVLAAAMILVARRLRGRTHYLDAFFPLVLLHWGHAANLLWGWQLQFFSSMILSAMVLLFIVQSGASLRIRTAAIAAGISILLLPLCGANGLGLVPALALWLLYLAVDRWRSPDPGTRRDGLLVGGMGVAALLLVVLYFIGYESVPWHPKTPGIAATLLTSIQFITIGLGPATRAVWPVSGLVALGVMLLSAALLVRVWLAQPEERQRATGLFLFLGAMASLALGLGLGREGFETRYVNLAVPAWLCVYFIWKLYAPVPWSVVMRMSLFVVALAALWPNSRWGLAYAQDLRGQLRSFERDMAAGAPPYELIARYNAYLHPHQDIPTEYLPMLRDAGVGKFRLLRENPPFLELPVPLVPSEVKEVEWDGGIARATGSHSHMVFSLPEAMNACGIRLKYVHSNRDRTLPYVSIYWTGGEGEEFTEERFKKYSPTGDRANWVRGTWTRLADSATTMTVWGCQPFKELRIHPDFKPGTFMISELVLLVSANGPE
jgi:hypothetical protein